MVEGGRLRRRGGKRRGGAMGDSAGARGMRRAHKEERTFCALPCSRPAVVQRGPHGCRPRSKHLASPPTLVQPSPAHSLSPALARGLAKRMPPSPPPYLAKQVSSTGEKRRHQRVGLRCCAAAASLAANTIADGEGPSAWGREGTPGDARVAAASCRMEPLTCSALPPVFKLSAMRCTATCAAPSPASLHSRYTTE